jgi:UDP-N-acetyl-D-mannosaminuronate dehydrogenase
MLQILKDKLERNEAIIAIIGLGYVGLMYDLFHNKRGILKRGNGNKRLDIDGRRYNPIKISFCDPRRQSTGQKLSITRI